VRSDDGGLFFQLRSKLPSDPIEAELLAMAGALAGAKNELDSSSEEDDDDLSDLGEMLDSVMNEADNHQMPILERDYESDIQLGRVMPKQLPMAIVEPSPQVQQSSAPNTGGRRGQKRRHSRKRDDGEQALSSNVAPY
jgi:hypothetical protein